MYSFIQNSSLWQIIMFHRRFGIIYFRLHGVLKIKMLCRVRLSWKRGFDSLLQLLTYCIKENGNWHSGQQVDRENFSSVPLETEKGKLENGRNEDPLNSEEYVEGLMTMHCLSVAPTPFVNLGWSYFEDNKSIFFYSIPSRSITQVIIGP